MSTSPVAFPHCPQWPKPLLPRPVLSCPLLKLEHTCVPVLSVGPPLTLLLVWFFLLSHRSEKSSKHTQRHITSWQLAKSQVLAFLVRIDNKPRATANPRPQNLKTLHFTDSTRLFSYFTIYKTWVCLTMDGSMM